MFERLKAIADKMEIKLSDAKFVEELQGHQRISDERKKYRLSCDWRQPMYWLKKTHTEKELKFLNIIFEKDEIEFVPERSGHGTYDYHYRLLSAACKFNMLAELKELLAFKPFDVNRVTIVCRSEYKNTLLGDAAYHGHLDIVRFLVEVAKADVNAEASTHGGSALHQVILGDSYPMYYYSYGTQHKEVAEYLLAHKASLTIKHGAGGKTPLELAMEYAPSLKEKWCGRSYDKPLSSKVYADRVRPVLQHAAKKNLLSDPKEKKLDWPTTSIRTFSIPKIKSVKILAYPGTGAPTANSYLPVVTFVNGITAKKEMVNYVSLQLCVSEYESYLDDETRKNLTVWLPEREEKKGFTKTL